MLFVPGRLVYYSTVGVSSWLSFPAPNSFASSRQALDLQFSDFTILIINSKMLLLRRLSGLNAVSQHLKRQAKKIGAASKSSRIISFAFRAANGKRMLHWRTKVGYDIP